MNMHESVKHENNALQQFDHHLFLITAPGHRKYIIFFDNPCRAVNAAVVYVWPLRWRLPCVVNSALTTWLHVTLIGSVCGDPDSVVACTMQLLWNTKLPLLHIFNCNLEEATSKKTMIRMHVIKTSNVPNRLSCISNRSEQRKQSICNSYAWKVFYWRTLRVCSPFG